MPSAGELSRSLVDAAAEALHSARCQCRAPKKHRAAYLDAGEVAVAAVLETLAAGIEAQSWPMSVSALRRLAVEARKQTS